VGDLQSFGDYLNSHNIGSCSSCGDYLNSHNIAGMFFLSEFYFHQTAICDGDTL
jgi:hypothetical protein